MELNTVQRDGEYLNDEYGIALAKQSAESGMTGAELKDWEENNLAWPWAHAKLMEKFGYSAEQATMQLQDIGWM